MLKKLVKIFGGDPNQRKINAYSDLVDQINALEADYEKLSKQQLRAKTDEFKTRLADGETLDDILLEAFATVREASKRTLGQRHYDVQLIGGIALHRGIIAEMRTGEGKTLVATLPVYLNALTGKGVHLITVNDYLARRDARWMAPIYDLLGLSVGVLQMAARTENGKKAFLVDLDKESSQEDQHQLDMVPRREAYRADITYGTNSEFGFDYLRDNMAMRMEERVQRGHYYAIIDEVDNVLIDEARTPLIISGPAQDEAEWYERMAQVVRQLKSEDYEVNEKDRNVTLTEIGETHVEELLGMPLRDPDRPEDVTNEQARLLGYLEQALRAQFLFRRNKDYLVQAGKVVIIDEFTGRLMPGRRWSDGLHQAVEAKEGVKVESESVTYATITIQNYFRMYDKLAGMTGTAVTEAEEFDEIYKLDVLAIPTNLEYEAQKDGSGLVAVDDRDEDGYKVRYYAHPNDPEKEPVFWQRKDFPDVVYRTEEAKLRSLAREILRYHALGRPILVGTTSVELSEEVSSRLKAEPLRRLAQVLVLREVWFQKNNREEDGRAVPELQFMDAPLESLEIAEMRRMARDLDISFNPNADENLERLRAALGLPRESYVIGRLDSDLKAGIPHEVLNARKHTEESQIIAGAGAFGAVTIATNMAGRGVDIKLGGELAEEISGTISRVLEKAGHDDPYSMNMEQRRQALLVMDPEDYGIYDTEVKYFLQYLEEMERVRELGGLHVIGSERHEARRIDNQLRGRSARQGDPGSSRFYLSMEDDLMRLFGGNQVDSLMQRLHIDDAMPLEVGLVSRIVEQSQTRVEGANFDVRKHLLEYDDVLNSQREKIYGQRDRIFTKDDLSEDVTDMLRTEVSQRVPDALLNEDGPWKLLAWLEQIQPSLNIGGYIFPSFTLKLLADGILEKHGLKPASQANGRESERPTLDKETARADLLEVARHALEAEKRRLVHTVDHLLGDSQDRLESQIDERLEALDMFFEGLELEDEETVTRSPAMLAEELNAVVRVPLRLSPSEQKDLRDNPEEIRPDIEDQVHDILVSQTVTRLIGSIERRLEEPLDINADDLPMDDWHALSDDILQAIERFYDQRAKRFFDPDGGLIVKDLDSAMRRIEGPVTRMHLLQLLTLMPQGARATFDKKTHRRVWQRTTRLSYADTAAERLIDRETEDVTAEILEHLENAMDTVQKAWGASEWTRLSAASATLSDLDEKSQRGLRKAFGEELFTELAGKPLQNLDGEHRQQLVDELGRQALTNIYRQLLLGVISELWVDYLTQMEALRISIGLEAYAQRDPLVQYKNRAYGLFQDLLANMRNGVVNRMFTYRPRDLESVQSSVSRSEETVTEEPPATPEAAAVEAAAQSQPAASQAGSPDGSEKKSSRKRRGKGKNISSSAKRRRSRNA